MRYMSITRFWHFSRLEFGNLLQRSKRNNISNLPICLLVLWAMPALGGINILTNGPSTSGSGNWSMASAPTASANSGSFQDLVFQPANTNNLYQVAGNLYSQSLNVTNGGNYTLFASNILFSPNQAIIRPGNTPGNTGTNFVNSVSGGAQDLFYLANGSSFAILTSNLSTGDSLAVPLQQGGNFNVLTSCTLAINVPITGSGSKNIVLTGGGTNVFAGANTYAGNTSITNGTTLVLSGVISNSIGNAITVETNSTLNEEVTGNLAGTLPLTINAGGVVILKGTNAYSGITKVVGMLQVSGAAALSTNSILNSGASTSDGSELNLRTANNGYTMSALSVGGIMRFTGPSSGSATLTFNGAAAQGFTGGGATKKISVATNVNLVVNGASFELLGAAAAADRNHTIQVDGAMTFNDAIIATGSSFLAGFAKSGSGVLTLAASNSYTGPTTVSAGTLKLGNGSALGDALQGTTVSSGGVLDLNGQSVVSEAVGLDGNGINSGGALINGSASGASLSGPVTLNANASVGVATNSSLTLSGGVMESVIGMNLTKVDEGTLILSGTSSYSGVTKINAGTVQVNSPSALSGSSILNSGGSTADTSTLNLAAASSGYTMNALSIGGVMRFTGPSSGSATLTFNGAAAQGITGSAATKKISVATNVNVVVSGSAFDILGAAATANRNHTIQVDGYMTFNAPITATGSAFTAGFTKMGAGVLVLTNSNTYTGATTVNEGTLLVNGDIAAGSVTVNSATLGGTGSISVPVTVTANGTLAPGASIGTLTINSNLTLAGNVFIEVNRSVSPSNDLTSVSGVLTNAGTGTVTMTNLGGTALAAGNKFKIFNKAVLNGAALTISGALPGGLIWSNSLATDGSISVLSTNIATRPTLSFATSNNVMTFSWTDASYHLQAQTNALSVGITTNWFDYPSGGASPVRVTNNPANPTLFFRLKSP